MSEPIRIMQGQFGRIQLTRANRPVVAHAHSAHHILVKYDGADNRYLVGEANCPFTRDTIVLVNALEVHSNPRPIKGAPILFLALYLSSSWLRQHYPTMFANDKPFPRSVERITPALRRLADSLVLEMVNEDYLTQDRLEFMLFEMVLHVVESYIAQGKYKSSLWEGSRLADARIRKAIQLLRANVGKEARMDEIAAQVGLSRSRFFQLFQLCTGLAPRRYLDTLCVESALFKLSHTPRPIAEIASAMGFSAQSHFSRFFLQHVGVTPSQYRRIVNVLPARNTDMQRGART